MNDLGISLDVYERAPHRLALRCDRIDRGRRCRKVAGEVIMVGGKLILLQAPVSLPEYVWPQSYDFDGAPIERRVGWDLKQGLPPLDLDKYSPLKKRDWIDRSPSIAQYPKHGERSELGYPLWSASFVEESPLVVACLCCSEFRVVSAPSLAAEYRVSRSSTNLDSVLHSGDARTLIAEYLQRPRRIEKL